jgi:hypothetical protein
MSDQGSGESPIYVIATKRSASRGSRFGRRCCAAGVPSHSGGRSNILSLMIVALDLGIMLTHGRAIFAKNNRECLAAKRLSSGYLMARSQYIWGGKALPGLVGGYHRGKARHIWICREVPKLGSPSDRTATQKEIGKHGSSMGTDRRTPSGTIGRRKN